MRRGRFASAWLWLTACVCGAVVMAVEFLGARMLSPEYGSSQTIWAAMISVTLLSLTAGYFAGGWLADRRPRAALLYGIILASAALIALCPRAAFLLGPCRDAFGLRAGALLSSLAVFFLPLGLLGMVSPFVIKVLTAEGRPVGLTAGGVYAVSTIGSVAGTLLTAFLLIPECGTPLGFRIVGATAGALAALGLVGALRAKAIPALIVPFACALIPSQMPPIGQTYTTAAGAAIILRDSRDSEYSRLAVLEEDEYYLLVANGIVQTGILKERSPLRKGRYLEDNYFQELLAYSVDDPETRSALLVGVAGGLTATILRTHGMRVDCVEIDPEVIRIARKWFSFQGDVAIADGRRFLEACTTRYDFCIIDTYSGDGFPFHMASVEGFRAARSVLKPGGVLALNFIGSPAGRPFACIHKTLRQLFPHVLALNSENTSDVQTITIFASERPIRFNKRWLDDGVGFAGSDEVSARIETLSRTPTRPDAFILTDAYNPVDVMRSAEALRWRERTLDRIGRGAGRRGTGTTPF